MEKRNTFKFVILLIILASFAPTIAAAIAGLWIVKLAFEYGKNSGGNGGS